MELDIKGKTYKLPMFLPDATHGSIKGVDSLDLQASGVKGVVVNTYHLLIDNAVELAEKAGGIKKFMNFEGLTVSDSGGFQAMSLVRRNSALGKITNDGVSFINTKNGNRILLTPELCIETQHKIGADIFMVLDDCTDPAESAKEQKISVERTVAWALRCRKRFDYLTKSKNQKPLLFAIIQGGNDRSLRTKCAAELIKIGFDGYAYGGWPMFNGGLITEILRHTANLMPSDKPKYAMGVGKPQDIIACTEMGYNMFDCVLPTRDARHGRLYVRKGNKIVPFFLGRKENEFKTAPISKNCGCYACKNYSVSYIRQMLKVGEPVGIKLTNIHNLYVFSHIF